MIGEMLTGVMGDMPSGIIGHMITGLTGDMPSGLYGHIGTPGVRGDIMMG